MKLFLYFITAAAAAWGVTASAQDEKKQPAQAETVKATYLVTGLHCGACATTLEGSLKKTKGVKSIKVNFKTKNAAVVFDEGVISAQEVALALARTPHMMGDDMQYGGALVLHVAGLKDKASAEKAKEALAKVEGVSKVTPSPKQQSVSIEFSEKGKTKSKALIEALDEAGLKGSHNGAGDAKKTSAARPSGEHDGMVMNGVEDYAATRMGAGGMVGARSRANGMGQRMGCGMATMDDMDDMPGMGEMDDMDADVAPPPPRRYAPPVAARRGYYRNNWPTGGGGCCR